MSVLKSAKKKRSRDPRSVVMIGAVCPRCEGPLRFNAAYIPSRRVYCAARDCSLSLSPSERQVVKGGGK